MGMQVSIRAALDCVGAFSETDLTDDLKRIDVAVFVAHGNDDQIVPIQAAGIKSAQILSHSALKVYPGAPHGLCGAYEQEFNTDLLSFITS